MDVFVCWDGDHIGRQVGRAVLSDNVEEVRRVDQAINAGNELWRSFALKVGGSVIEVGGDEGRIAIPAEHLGEMSPIARQYAETVGATVSVGVGMKMSDSAKALMVAKLRGGNQILVWSPDMQKEIEAATSTPESEKDKLDKEYLSKADESVGKNRIRDDHSPAKNPGPNAGFAVVSKPNHKVTPETDDVAPPPASAPAAPAPAPAMSSGPAPDDGGDLEGSFHQMAQSQDQTDQTAAASAASNTDQVRQQVAQVLGKVREQMPVIAQMRQAAPEAYASIMALVQGVIALGREVMGPGPVHDEDPSHVKEELQKSIAELKPGVPGAEGTDYTHLLPAAARAKWPAMKLQVTQPAGDEIHAVLSNPADQLGAHIGTVQGLLSGSKVTPHSTLTTDYHGHGLGQAMYEGLYAHAKNALGVTHVSGGIHSPAAAKVHQALASKHGFDYNAQKIASTIHAPYEYALKDEMALSEDEELLGAGKGVHFEKSGGSEAGRAHLNLPAGSTLNNKVKIRHADGNTNWVSVEAGMIQSQSPGEPTLGPNSHPVSSRNPNGK